jgi:hypothetical protein
VAARVRIPLGVLRSTLRLRSSECVVARSERLQRFLSEQGYGYDIDAETVLQRAMSELEDLLASASAPR